MVLAAPAAIALSHPVLRGVAGGVVFTGLGFGTALSGIVVPALVRIGLSTAWRSLSAMIFLLTVCCWNEFRAFSWTGVSDRPSNDQAFAKEPEFEWKQICLLIAMYSASAIGFVAHTVFWVDFIARGLGRGITAGGHHWTILGLSAACGPFLAGVVADRIGFRKALRWSFLANAIGVATPLFFTETWALVLSSVATGSMAFGIVPLAVGRAMELAPHSRRQQLWAWMTAAFSVAYAGNAYLFSFIFSRTGSFQLLFMIGAGVLLIGYGLDFMSDSKLRLGGAKGNTRRSHGKAIADLRPDERIGMHLYCSQLPLAAIGRVSQNAEDPATAGMRCYPVHFVKSCQLKNGVLVIIRAIRSSDELRLARFHETLSDDTVYFRYLSFIKLSERIAPAQIGSTCQVDDRHFAIVAVVNHQTRGEQEIIGLGQVSRDLELNEMELGLIVADKHQNQGLGTRLSECLLEISQIAGARRVVSITHLENYAMRVIARKLGFSGELEGHTLRIMFKL